MSKKSHLKKHAMRRATSRFELDFNEHIYMCACKCIQTQKEFECCRPIRCLERQSNNKTLWLIEVKNEQLLAAYDKGRGIIATFMPTSYRSELL